MSHHCNKTIAYQLMAVMYVYAECKILAKLALHKQQHQYWQKRDNWGKSPYKRINLVSNPSTFHRASAMILKNKMRYRVSSSNNSDTTKPPMFLHDIMTLHDNVCCPVKDYSSLAGVQFSLAGFTKNQHCSSYHQIENASLCISSWVLGPSQKMPIVLFIQYQRCWCLNPNKEGHWTELSVWLPFRTAVNAILLILLLKASLPARSLCEGNTMQAVQTPQKGIALESHTSAVWPLPVLWRSAESLRTPSQLQSGEQNWL